MKLLEHFNELTVHSKNTKKLKGLILQLAVQGKLSKKWRDENPEGELGLELLLKIQRTKASLIKEKKIRPERIKKEFARYDTKFSIPDTWTSTNITEVYHTIGGKQNQIKTNQYLLKGKFPVISQGKSLIEGYTNDVNKVLVVDRPVIVFGDHTREVKYVDFNFVIGADGTKILVPIDGLHSRYLYVFLLSIDLSSRGYARHYSHLKNEAIPIPPLEEQKVIVAIVNQLFEEVEQLEELSKKRIQLKEDFVTSALHQLSTEDTNSAWAFLQPHFKTFFTEQSSVKKLRETILQLAVQGKLTHHWRTENPHTESAVVLLERIKAEKEALIKAKTIKKEKPLPAINEDEIPYELPEGWVWCRMGELVSFMAYGTSQKTDDNHNNVPVLRMGNITSDGNLHFNNLKYIPANHKDLPKLYLEYGDLVFNRTNSYELVGKSGVFKGKHHSFTLASYLIKVSLFKEHVDSDYINNYIVSPVCRKTQIEPQITAQTNQANFSGSKLKEVLTPLPPIKEQKAIVEKVNALMALCDSLEKEIETQEATLEDWMQSCLREVV